MWLCVEHLDPVDFVGGRVRKPLVCANVAALCVDLALLKLHAVVAELHVVEVKASLALLGNHKHRINLNHPLRLILLPHLLI